MPSTPIVVSLEYIQSLEKTIRILMTNLQGANHYNTNLCLSDEIDHAVTHLRHIFGGLSSITADPSRFSSRA